MTLLEAYQIMEVDEYADLQMIKANYRWFIRFYHPDNKATGNRIELQKILTAYRIIQDHWET